MQLYDIVKDSRNYCFFRTSSITTRPESSSSFQLLNTVLDWRTEHGVNTGSPFRCPAQLIILAETKNANFSSVVFVCTQAVGVRITFLMYFSDRLNTFIFSRKKRKNQAFDEGNRWKGVIFQPELAFSPSKSYCGSIFLPCCTLTYRINKQVSLQRKSVKRRIEITVLLNNFFQLKNHSLSLMSLADEGIKLFDLSKVKF